MNYFEEMQHYFQLTWSGVMPQVHVLGICITHVQYMYSLCATYVPSI